MADHGGRGPHPRQARSSAGLVLVARVARSEVAPEAEQLMRLDA